MTLLTAGSLRSYTVNVQAKAPIKIEILQPDGSRVPLEIVGVEEQRGKNATITIIVKESISE